MTPRKEDSQMPKTGGSDSVPKKRSRATTPVAAAPAAPSKTRTPVAHAPSAPTRGGQTAAQRLGADDEGRALLVVFCLDGQRYAVPLNRVQEIQQIVALADIPDGSSSVVGMVNLRGSMVPAIDLRVRLGLSATPWGLQTPMVFCGSGDGVVAFIVDSVEDVIEVAASAMQPPSRIYELADMLLGVAMPENEPVLVLDVDKVIPPMDMTGEAS